MQTAWSKKLYQIYSEFNSGEKGLTEGTVKAHFKTYGYNLPPNLSAPNPVIIFLSQFKSPLIIILILVSGISFFVDQSLNGTIILIMLLVNAIIGFLQELKAQKSLEKLRSLISFKSKVIRSGREIEIDSKHLVPGDIVLLNMGNLIPADIKLIEIDSMMIDESSITGESLPVEKNAEDVGINSDVPQQIKNGLFMGTSVSSGSGKGIVVATGKNTLLYRTVLISSGADERTNFEKVLGRFSNSLLVFVAILTTFVFVSNVMLKRDIIESFLLGITLALGITPEVMPIIISIAISSASIKLSKFGVLIRRLNALEDLGNVDLVCADKTGTVTKGVLQLTKYINERGQTSENTIMYALVCNAYNPYAKDQLFPNPMDEEIWKHAMRSKFDQYLKDMKILFTKDFDFESRLMGVISSQPDSKYRLAIIKGATEKISTLCKEAGSKINKLALEYEMQGNRVISVAVKELTPRQPIDKLPDDGYKFLGFILFRDNPKESFNETIAELKMLNVDLKIITGDSPIITREICREAGMIVEESRVITGSDLEKLSGTELKLKVEECKIFARVSPEQKRLILQKLKENGHVVAYLGDGINDIGALRMADVGISVDSATDVTKDASDIVLLKKDLSVLARGITEGRKTFDNTIKFILNTMSSSFGNVLTIAIFSLFLKFMPFLPSQVLLIDSLSDIQHLTISTDNVDEKQIRKPESFNMHYFVKFMIYFGVLGTFVDIFFVLIFQNLFSDPDLFRTIWFIESILTELLATFFIRTKFVFFKSKPSKPLILTSLISILIGVGLTFTLMGHTLFGFVSINLQQFMIVSALVILYLIILEVAKYLYYKQGAKN